MLKRVENIVAKGEIAHFSFGHNVFKIALLQTRLKASVCGKVLWNKKKSP